MEKSQLIDHLSINNNKNQWKPDVLDTISSNQPLSIHLFLDINHLNRRSARKLFDAVFSGEFINHAPYPKKNIYIPQKRKIGCTKYLPRIKRVVKVKYPPGVMQIKKISNPDSLQEKPRLLEEQIKKYIADSILNNAQAEGKHLFLFAFEKLNPKQFRLIDYLQSVNKQDNLWSALYYEEPAGSIMEDKHREIVFSLGKKNISEQEKPFDKQISQWIRAINGNGFRLQFTDHFLPDTMRRNLSYRLEFNTDQNHYEQTLSIRLPDTIARKIYVQQVIQKVNSLQKQKLYPQALNYLWNRYKKTASPRLRGKSRELFISWSVPLKRGGCRDLDSLFILAEKRWNHSMESTWYVNLKVKLLANCYHCLKKQGASWEKQMAMITRLRNIRSTSEINREYWITRGQLAFNQSRYWESAYHFKQVHPWDKKLQQRLQAALEKAFKQSFQQEEHQIIYENGSDFLRQISSSPIMRHIYGHSCAALHHYRKAVIQYEWLLDNWKDSSDLGIELDTLYERLQNLYKHAMDFQGASELDKLSFRRNQRKDDLYSYLGNLRARYLKPLIKVLPDLMNKLNDPRGKHLFKNNPIIFQPFIRGIYMINPTKERLQTLYRKKQVSLPVDLALIDISRYPAYLESGTKKDFFLINQVNPKELIILHLDKSLTEKESALFTNIVKNPNQLTHWKKLIDHEQARCLKTLSQCITAMFKTEMDLGFQNPLPSYWSVLEKNDLLLYMVIHGENGKILDYKGFKKDHALYRNHQYKKSATTMAFYQQTIRYKNQRVFDVSNPIFRENGWYATLRMGFRKD